MKLLKLIVFATILHLAQLSYAIDCSAKLGQKRTDIRMTLKDAILCGQVDSIRWLVAHGAAVNAIDDSGETPLMFAITHQHIDMVQALLDTDADVHVHQKNTGKTARQIAADISKYDPTYAPIVQLLARHGSIEYLGDRLPNSEFDNETLNRSQVDVTGAVYLKLPFLAPNFRFFAVEKGMKARVQESDAGQGTRPVSTLYAVFPNNKVVNLARTVDLPKLGLQLQSENDALHLVRFYTNPVVDGWTALHFDDINLVELPVELPPYSCISVTQDPLKKAGVNSPKVETVVGVDKKKSFVIKRYMLPSNVDLSPGARYATDSVTMVVEQVSLNGAYSATVKSASTPGLVIENNCHAL